MNDSQSVKDLKFPFFLLFRTSSRSLEVEGLSVRGLANTMTIRKKVRISTLLQCQQEIHKQSLLPLNFQECTIVSAAALLFFQARKSLTLDLGGPALWIP